MRTFIATFIFCAIYPAAEARAKDALPSGSPPAASTAAVVRTVASTPTVSAAKPDYTDMVLIPAGEFMMGSPDEEGSPDESPRHKVSLDAYYIDRYKVTQIQYRTFAAAARRPMPKRPVPYDASSPVVYISWHNAAAYCEYYGKRLPTEAEWEKAARGGSEGKYSFGDDESRLGEYAWFWGNSGRQIHAVGRKKPNQYGLYDMHGNALEWTNDWYAKDYYEQSPVKNPQGPAEGEEKVVRGGSAFLSAGLCRAAKRMRSSPDTGYSGRGFRCAASPPQPPPALTAP